MEGTEVIQGSVLNANGALANSGARVVDQLSGVGVGFTIMLIVTLFSICVSFYLLQQLLSLIREGIKSNAELKGAIEDALNRDH